jgi:hypothetical protein
MRFAGPTGFSSLLNFLQAPSRASTCCHLALGKSYYIFLSLILLVIKQGDQQIM